MINRRQVIGALTAVATVGMPGRALAAGHEPDQFDGIPATLTAFGEGAGTADFPIGYLGLTWMGTKPGASVRFRVAGGWTAWRPLPAGEEVGRGRHGVLVPAGGACGYEVSVPAAAHALRTVAINTTDGPRGRRPAAAADALAVPNGSTLTAGAVRFLSRAGWGADEALRFGPDGTELFPAAYFPVQTLTVHHTVSDGPDPAATVRAIYHFQAVSQNFGDIGYHLLIDRNGTVYEGRWSGPDPIPVFGGEPDDTPRMSNAAHVGGFNAGNVGIALLGDLTSVQPTPAARRALVTVLAVLTSVCELDPLGQVAYVNPISGAQADVNAIAGHRDWAPTECPGNTFYPTLPEIRRRVAALTGGSER